MRAYRHPYQARDYTLLDNGSVHVVDLETGEEGVFALGGAWLEGTLRDADVHFIRYVYDCSAPVAAIAPSLRAPTDP